MLENSPDQNIAGRFYISEEYFLFGKLIKYFKCSSTFLLDTDHRCISDESIPLCHSPLYLPSPKSVPISITSLTLLRSSLFPLSHPFVGAYMLISIYAQGQSKYIFRFSLILFFYHIPFTVRIL